MHVKKCLLNWALSEREMEASVFIFIFMIRVELPKIEMGNEFVVIISLVGISFL